MENTGARNFKLNQFEYGFLVEDTDPRARVMKVECPKLTGTLSGGDKPTNNPIQKSNMLNDSESELQSSDTVSSKDYIEAKVSLELAHRHKWHDCTPQSPNCVNAVHTAFTCCPGTSDLKPCYHYHHDHHFPHNSEGMIPKGTKVILLFMDDNVNDCYVTRLWCEFPDGQTQGDPPRERMK